MLATPLDEQDDNIDNPHRHDRIDNPDGMDCIITIVMSFSISKRCDRPVETLQRCERPDLNVRMTPQLGSQWFHNQEYYNDTLEIIILIKNVYI